jgi:PKD repeat protein
VVVSPLQTSTGNQVSLSAQGTDEDGDPVEYRWTGTGGSIEDSSAASTTYTCVDAGQNSVTAAVSDDGFDFCVDELTVPVTCVIEE